MKFFARNVLFCVLVFNVLLFISCSKEKKEFSPPVIQFFSPGENASFSALDTVLVKARITDDENITLVKVTLKNENHVPVLSVADKVPNTTFYDLKVHFPLNDKNLNGRYYFDITAYNDEDYASSFRYIVVSSLPLEAKSVLMVEKGIHNTSLYSYDLDSSKLRSLATLEGDFMESAVDQNNARIFTVGRFSGGLVATDPTDGTELWSYKSGILPQVANFNDLGLWGNVVCVSREDGRILGFSKSGSTIYESTLENGFKPEKILLHNETSAMVFEQLDRSSGQARIQVEHFPSGLNKGGALFPYGKVAAMFSIDWDEVLILSNAIDGQYISVYNTEKHFVNKRDFGNYGDYAAVAMIDENTLVMTRGNDLVRYFIEEARFDILVKNYSPEVIRYNKAEFSLYCAYNGAIDVVDAVSGNIIGKLDPGINVSSLELLYNR